MHVSFSDWTAKRYLPAYSTNAGSVELAFQGWRRFKEAFAPEIVERAVAESHIGVKACLDPFGGSGTTALACQFLGVRPVTIEVNPYLADLIEAKLTTYNVDGVVRDLGHVLRHALTINSPDLGTAFGSAPPTFVEPGVGGRWILDAEIAKRFIALREAIATLQDESHRRLFRSLLGGIVVGISNVAVSGKGRRYRRGWKDRKQDAAIVERAFSEAVQTAIVDVRRFSKRQCTAFSVLRGDSRKLAEKTGPIDLCVFSPPYPNSFDYTDVYNVELWALGYLQNSQHNKALRTKTLSSHVQIYRNFAPPPVNSVLLQDTIELLIKDRDELWNKHIPEMVGGYFSDLVEVISKIRKHLSLSGSIWMVVGDSRYAGIPIRVAEILAELAPSLGFEVDLIEPCRSMRSSAQQGGRHNLDEMLVRLTKV